jgi:hypothetical protein
MMNFDNNFVWVANLIYENTDKVKNIKFAVSAESGYSIESNTRIPFRISFILTDCEVNNSLKLSLYKKIDNLKLFFVQLAKNKDNQTMCFILVLNFFCQL